MKLKNRICIMTSTTTKLVLFQSISNILNNINILRFSYGYYNANILIQLRLCYLNAGYLNITLVCIISMYCLSSINQIIIIILSTYYHINTYFTIRLLYPYVYGIIQDNQPFITTLDSLCLSGLAFLICISLDYNIGTLLEFLSSYDIVSYVIICLLLVFLLSENMFIISNLSIIMSSYYSSSTCNYNQTIQDYISLDVSELSSTNTVLLSNCSLSLGSIFISYETHLLEYHCIIVSILLSHLFISLQVMEYQYLSFYINESLTTSEFFILIGIHLCHVIIGI
jgi:hypothetical protein